MKKLIISTTFVFVFSFFFVQICFAQCSLDELMSFRKISSKFEMRKNLMLNDRYTEIRYWDEFGCNNLRIEGKKINFSSITANINDTLCLNGEYSNLCITYAENKLYCIEISANYSAEKFKECYENYKILLSSILGDYPNKQPIGFNNSGDPMGEGYYDYNNNNKQSIQVWYEFDYKYSPNPDSTKREAIRTSKIEGFKLIIKFEDNGVI